MFPIKRVRNLDLLDGTPDIPQEHCHKPRRTQMSPQESETAQCTPYELEMKPNSPALEPEQSRIPHHTR